MNELEKQDYFKLQNASEITKDTSIIARSRDITEYEPIKEIKIPEFRTATEAIREFKFNQQIIDDLRERITKEPDPTFSEKVGAGVDRAIQQLKHTPDEISNLMMRNISNFEFPNATMDQALQIAEASAYKMYLDNRALQEKQQREGTADSIVANLTQGFISCGQYALLNLVSGATVGTGIMGLQEAGSLSQSFVEKDIERGNFESAMDYKAPIKDIIAADTYGAVAGWIEKGFGGEAAIGSMWREILKSKGKSAAVKEFGKQMLKTGAGEGLEEFLQGEAQWAAGKFVGKEDKNFYEGLMDSLISGVYGAVIGSVAGGISQVGENGVARYYKARSELIEKMTSQGVDINTAEVLADQALTDTTGTIINELKGRNSLQTQFGEEWDKLVEGIKQSYISQGWEQRFPDKDVNEFARMNAVAMVAPVIELSNRTNMPLNQILDLTKFRQNQNALFIDLPNVDDPAALTEEINKRKEEKKRLKSMPATKAADTIKRLDDQIKILKLRLDSLESYNAVEKARMDAKKATLDNDLLASVKPEIMADLGGIRQAQRGESFVYVGNSQVPVRYVVKPMSEVQASHIAGEANPNYTLKELQNRTRGTVTDDAILQNRAANLKPEELAESPNTQYGAPVVNKNGEVISGNGRIETLRRAYELGNTTYKEMLDKLGYNTEGIERPVLVRETVEDLTPEQQVAIAEASNVSETSAFDHARQSMNDAKLLKKGVSDPLTFADELPLSERQAYIRENGQYDLLALQRRFDDAVLAWIIGDTKTFDSLVLANRLSQKVVKGLSLQGGNIVEFSKSNPALGIKKDLRYALVKSASIKTRGQFIPTVQQQDIEEGITFNADSLLYAMTFANNSSELSNFIGQYIETHQGYIDGQKDSFLADTLPKLSKEDITNQVLLNNPLTASKFDKDGTCTDSNLKAVILNRIPVENVGYGTIKIEPEESQLFQEQFNLANENARLDDIYPAYEGETITIDGKERTVYNSNGDRIAKSKEALENFYRWFGDSKVVDEQGRPLVVYHGTDKAGFNIFDKGKQGSNTGNVDEGFFFGDRNIARTYTKNYADVREEDTELDEYDEQPEFSGMYNVYLKIEEPEIWDFQGASWDGFAYGKYAIYDENEYMWLDEDNKYKLFDSYEDAQNYLEEKGYSYRDGDSIEDRGKEADYTIKKDPQIFESTRELASEAKGNGLDGVIFENINDTGKYGYGGEEGNVYVAFESNQIKSTSNRGTYSESENNIYYQEGDKIYSVFDLKVGDSLKAFGKVEEIDNKDRKIKIGGEWYSMFMIDSEAQRGGLTLGEKEDINIDEDEDEEIKKVSENREEIEKQKKNNKEYNEKAKDYFGTTDNLEVAGYILTDGDLLDLSGKKLGSDGRTRAIDHREISDAFEDNNVSMEDFINSGNIRYMPESGNILMADIPTASQYKVIDSIISQNNGNVYIELMSDANNWGSDKDFARGYPAGTTLNEIKRDINAFYKGDGVRNITQYLQRGKANINGFFDAELKTIVLGSNFNFGTLQHEFAHFFLKRVFDIYKTGTGTTEFNEWFSQLSSILDIKADQFALTTPQQEQFARMTESYLFNKAEFPEGAKPAMQMFFDWCPAEYNELLSIGWKDDKGIYHNSVFNKESLDFFNDMYSLVPELGDSPLVRTFTNETNQNGTIIPADSEQRKEREKLIGETPVETVTPETTQASINIQNTPDPEVEESYKEAIETEQERKKTPVEKFTQYVRIGRGTNTREEMDELAQDYIKKHRENAERVAFGNPIPSGYEDETGLSLGYVENNTGIDRAVLILNLMNEYTPNSPEYNQLYHNFAIYRSYASKSAGLTNDVNTNYYLKGYVEINKALTQKAALVKYGKTDNAVNLWNRDIDRFISQNIDKVYNTEPESAERDQAIKQFIEDAKAMFNGEDVLYQEEIRIKKAKDKQTFIDWANRTVKQIAKGKMAPVDEKKLMELSVRAQKASKFIDSNNIDEAVAASQDIRAWQDFVNQKGIPESFADKLIGTYLPSAMLSSPSTHILNAVSNFFNNFSVRLASRLHYGANAVSGEVLEQEYNRLKAIYAESGHNLSEDLKPDDVSRLHGEHWQFKKPESKIGYLAPMRLLGWSDFYFRAHTYVDTLARIATKDAKGDPKKALELFNEYKQMNSVNEKARQARLQAIITGHIAVFTKNGVLSNVSARARSALDLINLVEIGEAGHKGLGTLTIPFAKVPANIVGMGLQAVGSPFKLLAKMTGLKKDWTIDDMISLTNFGLFSAIVGIYLMAGLDYEPPYEPPSKYDPQKPYDSIKIGNAWVSVESFGALANPLRFTFTMLDMLQNGKKMESALMKSIDGLKNDIPFTNIEFDNDYMKKKPADWLVNTTYNQMSKAVPAILKKPIAWTNRELGLEISQDSALKRKIARQYGLDGKKTTINDYLSWIYRGIKIEQ